MFYTRPEFDVTVAAPVYKTSQVRCLIMFVKIWDREAPQSVYKRDNRDLLILGGLGAQINPVNREWACLKYLAGIAVHTF